MGAARRLHFAVGKRSGGARGECQAALRTFCTSTSQACCMRRHGGLRTQHASIQHDPLAEDNATSPKARIASMSAEAAGQRATFSRSVPLFRLFLREQSNPQLFYTEFAKDSVATLQGIADLDGRPVV